MLVLGIVTYLLTLLILAEMVHWWLTKPDISTSDWSYYTTAAFRQILETERPDCRVLVRGFSDRVSVPWRAVAERTIPGRFYWACYDPSRRRLEIGEELS